MLPSSGERQRDQMPMPPPKLPTPNATSVDGHGSAPSSRTQDSEKERQERLIKEQQAKEKRRLIARMAMEEGESLSASPSHVPILLCVSTCQAPSH